MALAKPHPFTTKSGVYHRDVRAPNELREVARGRPVTLPIKGQSVTVTVTDKVYVSLRTKSAREAKDRFQIALNRLATYWDSLRTVPVALTPIQVKALAGETYRSAVERLDADFDFDDRIEASARDDGAATQSFIDKGCPQKWRSDERHVCHPDEANASPRRPNAQSSSASLMVSGGEKPKLD